MGFFRPHFLSVISINKIRTAQRVLAVFISPANISLPIKLEYGAQSIWAYEIYVVSPAEGDQLRQQRKNINRIDTITDCVLNNFIHKTLRSMRYFF